MYTLSEWYKSKSETEQRLSVMQSIVDCEKMLKSDSFSLSGKRCFHIDKLTSVGSSIRISADLSDKLHQDIIKLLEYRLNALKELLKKLEK